MNNLKNLHQDFVRLGNDRRKLTNELLALLPEIYASGIWKKYAGSIVEYAGKFGGLSNGVVLKRLRLEKYVQGKPMLIDAIRTEGVHKVAMMASLVTAENEEFLVDKIKNMSKAAVQELSREMRSHDLNDKHLEEGLFASNSAGAVQTVSCKAIPSKITIELDEEMSFLFLKLKKKIGKNLSNKEVMKKVLEMAMPTDQKILPGESFAIKFDSVAAGITNYLLAKPTTRYIPSKIKKQIISKTNGKCSYPNCNKPAEIFHHTDRFAVSHSHDSLTSLCKIHHEFAHNGLIKNETEKSSEWRMAAVKQPIAKVPHADILYKNHRNEAIS